MQNLPALSSGLIWINCDDNKLTSLSTLPANLLRLYVNSNKLQSVPPLPQKLNHAFFLNNPGLQCLPYLPPSLSALGIDTSSIKCIPNKYGYTTYYTGDPANYKIYNQIKSCNSTNNINNCLGYPVIAGNIYLDLNSNNKKDTNDFNKQNAKVSLSNGDFTFTDKSGRYELNADSLGSYTITTQAPHLFASQPISYTHNFSRYDTLVNDTFALQPIVIKDSLTLTITPLGWAARPGFEFPYLISSENVGTTILNPTLILTYDTSKLTYNNSSNLAVVNSFNQLVLSTTNMVPGQIENFVAYFTIKPTTVIGEIIKSTVTVTAATASATDSSAVTVRGSFDPNDKQATPVLTPAQVAAGTYINYTVRFQNTGNDTAFTVVIADTLENKLQANTLQVLNSSHNCQTTVQSNRVYFEFKNINLPDSHVNKTGSNGFVSFRVKPIAALTNGNIVNNKASIYFDYNTPIVTNTATTQINTSGVVVPVRFTNYTASLRNKESGNREVENKWSTSTELNTLLFNVQRSDDGKSFKTFGTVKAKGNGSSYEFVDELPGYYRSITEPLTLYYRLQIIDKGGSISYSTVKQIAIQPQTPNSVAIYPNPANRIVNVGSKVKTTATIVTITGTIIKTLQLATGINQINIQGIPAGTYYIKTDKTTQQLIIQ